MPRRLPPRCPRGTRSRPTIASEGRGRRARERRMRAFDRRLDLTGGQGVPFENTTPGRRRSSNGLPVHPSASIARRATASGSPANRSPRASRRRSQRPHSPRWSGMSRARGHRSGWPSRPPASRRGGISSLRLLALAELQPIDLGNVPVSLRVFPRACWRRRPPAKELRQVSFPASRGRFRSRAPPSCRFSSLRRRLPGGLRGEQHGAQRPGRLALPLEHRDRRLRLAEGRVRVARPSDSPAASSSRASPSSARSPCHSSSEELEHRPRRAHRLVRAEGLERRLRQAQAVVDRLLGDIPLVEVVDELRAARDPAGLRAASRAARRTGGAASAACAATRPA